MKGKNNMKKTIQSILSLSLALLMILASFAMVSCNEPTPTDILWENAPYTEDTALGTGSKRITVKVTAGEKSITFTLETDKENLADAMLEHELVEGDESQFGLYIKKVNGILADYDVDQTYWALLKNGEATATGASGVTVEDGAAYEFKRAK